MPNNLVKTAADERHWKKAKDSCDKDDYKCINGIFQKIKKNAKKESTIKRYESVFDKKVRQPLPGKGPLDRERNFIQPEMDFSPRKEESALDLAFENLRQEFFDKIDAMSLKYGISTDEIKDRVIEELK